MQIKPRQMLPLMILLVCVGSLLGAERKVLLSTRVATNGEFLTVPVVVAGRQYTFVVDTGSTATVLDSKFLNSLSLPDKEGPVIPVREGKQSKLYTAPPMKVVGTESGELLFPIDSPVLCLDLADLLDGGSDKEIDGVLGMDFLQKFAVKLDLTAGRMQILDSDSVTADETETAIPLEFANGTPRVLVESSDARFWSIVDTGALPTLCIRSDVHNYLLEQGTLTPWRFEVEVEGDKRVGIIGIGSLASFKLGPFEHNGLTADEAERGTLLGLAYWKRYQVTFDFPHKTALLRPSRYFRMIDETGHSGIFLKAVDESPNQKEVGQIVLGCFAERAGIKIGDRVLSINGNSVENMPIDNMNRRLSQRWHKECVLMLERDGESFAITLPRLKEMPAADDPGE
ncbi:aspartyl protease family protein [Bremerella sp. JC817]|uniref:aspartyl protease family protein n=1 Tax=Bremerella sp. JC817 TaxID=3231756 RepID=UPI00345B1945